MDKSQLAEKIKQAAYLEGDFLLRSGQRSKYYLDKYLFESRPEILSALGELFAEKIRALGRVDLIAAPELGAVALAAAASLAGGKPFVIVRKAGKDYATGKLIEGPDVTGKRVVLIEDIGTTAGAALQAAETLTKAGAELVALIFAIDRMQGARQNVVQAGFRFDALLTREDMGI